MDRLVPSARSFSSSELELDFNLIQFRTSQEAKNFQACSLQLLPKKSGFLNPREEASSSRSRRATTTPVSLLSDPQDMSTNDCN